MTKPLTNLPTRRGILGGLAGGSLAACSDTKRTPFTAQSDIRSGRFSHGIASGDPFTTSVILWTRITPKGDGDISVSWEISKTQDFSSTVAKGEMRTGKVKDYTVKINATGLESDSWYFYRFRVGDAVSPVGRTRTLPDGPTPEARFAVVSCANWQHGYFNVYDHIAREAKEDPFDALIHLGDYYYEYPADPSPRLADRVHDPKTEIISLDDYRLRHAQYRSDPNLQDATAQMPLIAVWDDHESSNDSWKSGAENHNDGEGSWESRKEAALRAYYEWMPLREPKFGRSRSDIYRAFEWGDLASLVCVETRLTARAEQIIVEDYLDEITAPGGADKFKEDKLYDPSREMFGQDQQNFIVETLKRSKQAGKPWRLLINQVIMGRLLTPDFTPYIDEAALIKIEKDWAGVRAFLTLSKYSLPVYPDSWDGYPVARENFYDALSHAGVNDMVVLTGDAHEFWVNDLKSEKEEKKFGVELVTSSVSSQTLLAYLGDATADHNLLLTQSNADARYYNAMVNGYVDLRVNRREIKTRMVGVSSVLSRDYEAFEAAAFTLRKSGETVKVGSPKGLNLKQRALFHGLG